MAKALKYALGALVDGLAAPLVGLGLLGPRRRGAAGDLPEAPRFLLLVLDHLGDAVLATGLPAALLDRFPSARIHVLVRPPLAGLFQPLSGVAGLRLEEAPWFGARAGWLRPGYWPRLASNIRWIRKERFDAILDLRGDLRHLLLFGGLGRPRLLLGQLRSGGRSLVSVALPWNPAAPELEKKLALVQALGRGAPRDGRPRVELSGPEREAGRRELAGLRPSGPLLLLDPGGKPVQRWRLERFARVAAELLRDGDAAIALSGAPGLEQGLALLAAEIRALAGPQAHRRLALLGPARDVRALAARVAAADLVLSCDTGIAPLAGALGVPAVTLFGPTDPGRFWFGAEGGRALRSERACCRGELHERCSMRKGSGPGACMEGIPIERVLEALRAALAAIHPA